MSMVPAGRGQYKPKNRYACEQVDNLADNLCRLDGSTTEPLLRLVHQCSGGDRREPSTLISFSTDESSFDRFSGDLSRPNAARR